MKCGYEVGPAYGYLMCSDSPERLSKAITSPFGRMAAASSLAQTRNVWRLKTMR